MIKSHQMITRQGDVKGWVALKNDGKALQVNEEVVKGGREALKDNVRRYSVATGR